jgi:sulfite reductase beta subunit-like hemoprotein
VLSRILDLIGLSEREFFSVCRKHEIPSRPCVTKRGDVELHGVRLSALDRVLDQIRLGGLTGRGGCGDTVRNVVGCSGAGVCAEELYDTYELVRRISDEYTGVAAFERLPRKFKISVSGCANACACPQIQDIGIVANWVTVPLPVNRKPGFEGAFSATFRWIVTDTSRTALSPAFSPINSSV